MKCVKNVDTGTAVRVHNDDARQKVKTGKWNYCPKSEYKAQIAAEAEAETERRRKK